MTKDPYN